MNVESNFECVTVEIANVVIRLHNIIGTDARNTSAQRVGHDHTGPSIQHVNNSELRENAAYESILYFTHKKH